MNEIHVIYTEKEDKFITNGFIPNGHIFNSRQGAQDYWKKLELEEINNNNRNIFKIYSIIELRKIINPKKGLRDFLISQNINTNL